MEEKMVNVLEKLSTVLEETNEILKENRDWRNAIDDFLIQTKNAVMQTRIAIEGVSMLLVEKGVFKDLEELNSYLHSKVASMYATEEDHDCEEDCGRKKEHTRRDVQ